VRILDAGWACVDCDVREKSPAPDRARPYSGKAGPREDRHPDGTKPRSAGPVRSRIEPCGEAVSSYSNVSQARTIDFSRPFAAGDELTKQGQEKRLAGTTDRRFRLKVEGVTDDIAVEFLEDDPEPDIGRISPCAAISAMVVDWTPAPSDSARSRIEEGAAPSPSVSREWNIIVPHHAR
jgi:hypothetical protein